MFSKAGLILVADDMSTMRKLVIKALKDLGFSDFVEAQNGVEAWDKFSNAPKPIQLVISDYNMPEATGLEFLKKIRNESNSKTVPFILLTAESEASVVKEAIGAGTTGYIVKPFTVAALSAQLNKAAAAMKK